MILDSVLAVSFVYNYVQSKLLQYLLDLSYFILVLSKVGPLTLLKVASPQS